MATPCPKCGKNLKKGESAIYCEGSKLKKVGNDWVNEGDCDFSIRYDQKKFFGMTLSPENIRTLIGGGVLTNSKGDKMKLDINEKHCTSVERAEKKPDEDF